MKGLTELQKVLVTLLKNSKVDKDNTIGIMITLKNQEEIMKDMANLCLSLIKDCDLTLSDIAYAGIATPGTANSETGVVEYANKL